MSTDEFQQLWKTYDARLERSMDLNRRLLEEVKTGKVRRSFSWLMVCKAFAILLGIGWNILCGALAWGLRSEPFFVAAMVIIILVTSLTICGYVVQLLLLAQINMTKSILGTQKQLAQLEAVIVATYRLSILQVPAWTFMFVTKEMVGHMGVGGWCLEIGVVLGFVAGTIWLYRKINVRNIEKRWMQKLFQGLGVRQIARARGFIKEIGEYGAE